MTLQQRVPDLDGKVISYGTHTQIARSVNSV
jgi:hypothetical protein